MLLVIGSKVPFTAVKVGRFPTPFPINPIVVFVFVQVNSKVVGVVGTNGVPDKIICGTVAPTQ
jgi:hypothetical protein